eukprot:scaffold14698_cov196-Amphora_coffeaeformis.AAC.12
MFSRSVFSPKDRDPSNWGICFEYLRNPEAQTQRNLAPSVLVRGFTKNNSFRTSCESIPSSFCLHTQNDQNPSTMHLAEAKIQVLRHNVNAATAALAAGLMLNDDAAEALLWILHSKASQAHAALQEEEERLYEEGLASEIEQDAYFYLEEYYEGLPVQTVHIEGTICGKTNPLVFGLPFAISPTQISSLPEAGDILASICAVALFNLGLSRHTQSFVAEKLEEQNDLLEQAKELYTQSLDLLDQMKSLTPDGTLIQVYLANCNNLVEVYSKLGQDEEAAGWQETLCQSFWTVPPEKSSPAYCHFLNASESYSIDVLPMPMMDVTTMEE